MGEEQLAVETSEGVRWLRLHRIAQRNALTPALIERLSEELAGAEGESAVRIVVLAGDGETFCAGYDVNLLESPGTDWAGAERDLVESVCSQLRDLRLPTIACVDGVASGAGCDLAVSCDLRFASTRARFAMPPARLGILYSHEGIARLAALVGPAVAKELLFSGSLVEADRALAVGLVNRVYPPAELEQETAEFAAVVAANAPLSIAGSKTIVNLLATGAPLPDELLARIDEAGRAVWASEDAMEGPRAFRERRRPRFRGR